MYEVWNRSLYQGVEEEDGKKWRIPEHNIIKHWQSQGGVKVQFFSRPDLFSSHINGMEGEGEVQEASPEREGAQVWG